MLAIVSTAALQRIQAVGVLDALNSGESGDPRLIKGVLPSAANIVS